MVALIRAAALGHAVRSEQLHQTHLNNDRAFFSSEALRQPLRVTKVIGVVVGDDNARDWFSAHRARKVLLPDRARRLDTKAGINSSPTVAFLDQPQVNVI